MTAEVRPGDAPVAGPLGAAVVEAERWRGTAGWHVLYADLDLAERSALARTLGRSDADLELVRAALARWGADAPLHLGGQFAVAAWDGDRQRVVAVRDGIGFRPLVFAARPGRLVVGGDVRAVLAAGVPDDLDEDVMAAVLLDVGFRPVSVGRTCYRAVDELRGGDRLVWAGQTTRVETWWDPEDVPSVPVRGLDAVGEALRAVLREVSDEAVRGGPAGVHLSSGIDSGTVAAFAAEAAERAAEIPPVAFSWQWPPGAAPAPEHARVAAVAERWGLPVVWCPPTLETHLAAYALDPTLDPATMWAPEESTRHAASARGVRVLLSGWGGDEATSYSGRGRVSGHLLRHGPRGPLATVAAADPVYALQRLRSLRQRRERDRIVTLGDLRDAALAGDHASFVRPEVLRRATLPEPEPPPSAPRAHLAWLWRRGHLGMRASAWARAGVAYGLRYRYPLLDRRVLALVMGVPLEAWLPHRRLRRWPLRAAGAGLVPDAVRLHSAKAEPQWSRAAHRLRRDAAERIAPLIATTAFGPLDALLDRPALVADLTDWLAQKEAAAPDAPRGLHVIPYLPLATVPHG